MKSVASADLVRYNANTRGTRTGDCSVRAISLAFNKDYREIKKMLNSSISSSRAEHYNSSNNILYALIHSLNVPKSNIIDIRTQAITVEQFADQNPSGTYLVGCSKHANPSDQYIFGGHLVTIINGKIFDTWDSRHYYVCKYIAVSGQPANLDSQIVSLSSYLKQWSGSQGTSLWWGAAFKASLDHAIDKSRRLKKLATDNDIDITISGDWRKVTYNSFVFVVPMVFNLAIPDYNVSEDFNKTVKIQIKPSVNPNRTDLETYIYEALDIKISDIIWAIIKAAEDIVDGYKLVGEMSDENFSTWDHQTQRIFNTLPYWVRRITTGFYIDRYRSWGEPSQHIVLKIRPLPNDTENESGTLKFDADDKGMLMEMLNHYKETGNYEEAYDIRYTY